MDNIRDVAPAAITYVMSAPGNVTSAVLMLFRISLGASNSYNFSILPAVFAFTNPKLSLKI